MLGFPVDPTPTGPIHLGESDTPDTILTTTPHRPGRPHTDPRPKLTRSDDLTAFRRP
ncbi:hypothetical protein QFZ74_003503 [Streptomyces sp. V3I7]|nr:hypothetical protein [Streptomyces sp. V3I7]